MVIRIVAFILKKSTWEGNLLTFTEFMKAEVFVKIVVILPKA